MLFALGFVFYLLRAMSPGDVKLLAGTGVYLGWEGLSQGIFWIAISGVIVGMMYGVLSRHQPVHPLSEMVSLDSTDRRKSVPDKRSSGLQTQNKLQMPFAPVVVIGLALHSYFG
ncbi:A24 family peptidase [Vibrio sp. PP-XX7]